LIKGLRTARWSAVRGVDAEFGTADFLLLLDFGSLKPEYLKRLGLVDVTGNEAPA
jgi:hypothetical protein